MTTDDGWLEAFELEDAPHRVQRILCRVFRHEVAHSHVVVLVQLDLAFGRWFFRMETFNGCMRHHTPLAGREAAQAVVKAVRSQFEEVSEALVVSAGPERAAGPRWSRYTMVAGLRSARIA